MADRQEWDRATAYSRHLAIAADAGLRQRHPGEASAAFRPPWLDAILQPRKPQITPSAQILQLAAEHCPVRARRQPDLRREVSAGYRLRPRSRAPSGTQRARRAICHAPRIGCSLVRMRCQEATHRCGGQPRCRQAFIA